MSEPQVAHYLCVRCNARKIAEYVVTQQHPDMYAVCGHLFSYGENTTGDSDRCVVCMDLYAAHDATHEEESVG